MGHETKSRAPCLVLYRKRYSRVVPGQCHVTCGDLQTGTSNDRLVTHADNLTGPFRA